MSTFGGGHKRRSSGHKRSSSKRRHTGGCGPGSGIAVNAMEWLPLNGVPRVEGMFTSSTTAGGGQSGGHRCSMRHRRSKRTRKAHAGRKSRKHKSRGKKYGMGLRGIFGRY